ncbi:MAG: 2OG-Fe(II) oxygenase [Pirellulaceae bacterium]
MANFFLTSEWREWIEKNLDRNCSTASMIAAMVSKDFDPVVAAECIATVADGRKHSATSQLHPAKLSGTYQREASRIAVSNEIRTRDRIVPVEMRMQRPDLLRLRGVLSQSECEELIRRASEKVKPSTTVDPETGENKVIANRTSVGTYFHLEENDFIAMLDRRLSDLVNWPIDQSEGIQILNYRIGGEYKPHFDFFPPEDAGSAGHMAKGGQRVGTIIIYLNEVEEGGETIFPEISLSISPHPGDAIYFGYCNTLGQVDRLTLHGGNPVVRGEKWIATKWLRQFRRQ